jgi:hypothetical protein
VLLTSSKLTVLLSRTYSCLTAHLSEASGQIQCFFLALCTLACCSGQWAPQSRSNTQPSFAASFNAKVITLCVDLLLDKAALLRDKTERIRRDLQRCLPFETWNLFKNIIHKIVSCFCYKTQPVNAVSGNWRCLLWEWQETNKYTLWAKCTHV